MEMCPTASPSALFPTVIYRHGKWVIAVPIAIAHEQTVKRRQRSTERFWGLLRNLGSPVRLVPSR